MMNTEKNMVSGQYKKLIERHLSAYDLNHVSDKVMGKIAHRRLVQARFKAMFYGIFVIGTLISIKPAFSFFMAGAEHTGFLEYISLIMSGGISFAQTWTHLSLSILESLPVLEIISLFGVVFLFIHSTKHIVSEFKKLSTYENQEQSGNISLVRLNGII